MKTVLENYESTLEFLKTANAPEDLVDFIAKKIAQEKKTREAAKTKRFEETGGVKKDAAFSEFYQGIRDKVMPCISKQLKTGDELSVESGAVNSSGTPVLAAQIATALRPLINDGVIVVEEKKINYTDSKGLNKEAYRKAYRLA